MLCCNKSIQKLGYEKSLAKGKIQVLRLASLDEKGNIKVQSVDIEVNDDTFQDVGICSYTWGFDRVEWYDEETGMTWEVASRCEEMCKAALMFFPRIWVDGLCMIQVWKNHVSDNMKIMGRLYWHGNVVPEMVLEQMAPEYPLRGWVQQEISFTNLQYCITPLQNWFNANHKLVQEISIYLKKKDEANGDTSGLTYPDEPFDYLSFHKAVDASIPFFNVLSRVTEGRNSKDAIALKEKIASLLSTFQGHLFMGSFGQHTLEAILSMNMSLTGVLKRESNTEGSINGAVQSFRTGFFRYNTDRTVASFSLAGYICGEEDLTLFTKKIEANFVPRPLVGVTINGNPGRWCTGLAPIASIKTANWPTDFMDNALKDNRFDDFSKRDKIDSFFSILHGSSKEYISKNYEYVIGFKRLEKEELDSCHFGMRKKGDPASSVYGLVTANVPIDIEGSEDPYYSSAGHIVNQHIKMELGMRAISLLNSSWYVKSSNDPDMVFPTDGQTLRLLDIVGAPPFGEFRTSMKFAIYTIMNALACAAATARHPENYNVDLAAACWGNDSLEHTDL